MAQVFPMLNRNSLVHLAKEEIDVYMQFMHSLSDMYIIKLFPAY